MKIKKLTLSSITRRSSKTTSPDLFVTGFGMSCDLTRKVSTSVNIILAPPQGDFITSPFKKKNIF